MKVRHNNRAQSAEHPKTDKKRRIKNKPRRPGKIAPNTQALSLPYQDFPRLKNDKRTRRSKRKNNNNSKIQEFTGQPKPNKNNRKLQGTSKQSPKQTRKERWMNFLAQRHTRSAQESPSVPETSKAFAEELEKFKTLRQTSSSTTVSSIPSQELIWTRDASGAQPPLKPLDPPEAPSKRTEVDDEIEDGEIVEQEVEDIVDLLQQSVRAVENSRKSNIYFEDRNATGFGPVPMYNTFSDASKQEPSDDVICIDSSFETTSPEDDSVIFVSEEARNFTKPLAKPACLSTPTVNKLWQSVQSPVNLSQEKSNKRKIRQNNRFKAYQLKNGKGRGKKGLKLLTQVINVDDESSADEIFDDSAPEAAASEESTKQQETSAAPEVIETSTSTETSTEILPPKPKEKVKRIILIDGSNVAMQFNEVDKNLRSDKHFSAEGLKICIDHFESMGFQVKAVVPEYRVCRGKSSNHDLMNEMKGKGKLMLTPKKSYDDRVILEGALRLDAAVVSNDFFRDLIQEKPEYRELVNTRLIRFNWLFHQLIIPEDPHGRNGPKLNEILYK